MGRTRRRLRIGELAAATGVPRSTLRFYERRGILPPPARTPSGYRAYDREAIDQVRFVRKAQAVGLRLADVRDVLRAAAAGRSPCAHVRRRLEVRLREVERQLAELRSLRSALQDALGRLDAAPARPGPRCSVIEAIELEDPDGPPSPSARAVP